MFYGTQSELMQSEKVRQRAAARVETLHPELQAAAVSLNVGQQHNTSFFVLSAIGDKADYTRAFLEACMEEYMHLKRELRSSLKEETITSIMDQVLRLEKEYDSGVQEMVEYQKNNNVPALQDEGNSAAKYLNRLNEKLDALNTEYRLLGAWTLDQNLERKQQGNNGLGKEEPTTETSGPNVGAGAEYLKAKQEVQILKAEKERHARFMRPKHPIMEHLDAEIAQQERLIDLFGQQSVAQLANKRDMVRIEIETLEGSIKEQKNRALELDSRISEFTRLKSKAERSKQSADNFQSAMARIETGTNTAGDGVTIMEHASVPTATKLGLVKDLTVGGASGLIIGLGILFLTMLLDDRIVSADELRERFQEELLGQIPREVSKTRLNILTLNDKQHVFTESYRNLRSTLHFMSFEEPRPRTFLITSAVPGEGKSTVAANLAITIAGGGARTLLIDADLRKGVSHEYFSVESAPGLSAVLTEQVKWKDAVIATCVTNLSLLPRGAAVPGTSEHFLSKVTDRLLQEVYADFDCIIVDSAPVLANDDTASLAPKIDATLFVVRAGVSSARLTQSALDALRKRQVNVLGMVLNAADGRSAEYYYYHRYGEYYSQPLVKEKS